MVPDSGCHQTVFLYLYRYVDEQRNVTILCSKWLQNGFINNTQYSGRNT